MSVTVEELPLTLAQIIDLAAKSVGAKSYDSLAKRLGIHPNTIYQWRAGKRLPSDELMLAMGDLADILPMEILLLLNTWRATGRARQTYSKWLRVHGHHYISGPGLQLGMSGKSDEFMADLRSQMIEFAEAWHAN
ncbi:MAG: helix-turn-helix domain-containing protein [Rhizomicrobium sp.]